MSKQQRLVLIVSILASFVAFLDGSIVNVALPAISRELGGGLVTQQWVVDAYLITLGALMLIAGSFSDIFGHKKILVIGLIGFGITSLLCAVSPTDTFLIVSRVLQGVAGALLVPSSLAFIIANFSGPAESKAIGTWTAWTGIAYVVGSLVGGVLVDAASWRLIFAINILPIAITVWLISRLKSTEHTRANTKVDIKGAVYGIAALGLPVFALIEHTRYGWGHPLIFISLILGVLAFIIFIWHEKQAPQPMLPLKLFAVRNFSWGNVATFAVYGGLGVATFLITVFIQQVGHYSAIESGLALLPVTIIMFIMSSRFGALAGKYGPRIFMTLGPIISGIGFLWMLQVDQSVNYWWQIFPGVLIFGVGLSTTVAPLTAAILGSINKQDAGIGSAVNNAVSRIAGLVAIAGIGVVIGPNLDLTGFHRGLVATAILLITGGIISWLGIRNHQVKSVDQSTAI
ncbi:MAG TPA: MFS transporter [Candidatus Saccharimonadales bacterium]|nr:MFS transporter [Candidatus Saccharimonadales bacterium]